MSDRERVVILALATLLLFLAPGYVVHVSPRFAGSLTGGILGIVAAVLMLLMLVYPAVKYVPWLKSRVTPHVSLARMLSLHVWGGLLGAITAVVHSGHKYESVLGIALVVDILVVVGSGFIGRYYLGYLGGEVRREQALLGTLRNAYDQIAGRLVGRAGVVEKGQQKQVLALVDAIAEAEYALTVKDAAKRITSRWMVVHVASSIVLYALLLAHIGSGIYYGLRWAQ